MSLNPTNKSALTPKVLENGAPVADILQELNRIELTVDTPAATPATNVSPYGFTQDQANAILNNLREIRAGLIELGLFKDDTVN